MFFKNQDYGRKSKKWVFEQKKGFEQKKIPGEGGPAKKIILLPRDRGENSPGELP